MAKKLFVKLQSPSVEIKVTSAESADNQTSSIIVAFKRYPVDKIQAKLDTFTEAAKLSEEAAVEFIKSEILYIKDASVDIYDDSTFEFIETIKVEDTRTAQPVADFWEDSDSCLTVLTDNYLLSAPWKSAFSDAFIKAVINRDFKEAEVKN